ncbi:MAG: hypothetical protein RMM06_02130 [Armatimonadota bacterium]|nr:hypothetical protein [Armatimonadota bacterium]
MIAFYVVTPEGFSERLPETSSAPPPLVRVGEPYTVTRELCVPLGYPDSVSYLDVVARLHGQQGSKPLARWRLVNLPRSVHALKPPVQTQNTARTEDFEIQLEARSEPGKEKRDEDFGELLMVHYRTRVLKPGADMHLHWSIVEQTPEWAAEGATALNEEIVSALHDSDQWRGSGSTSLFLHYPRYQRYVRLVLEGWLTRRRQEERAVTLPVRQMRTEHGRILYIAAPDKPLTVVTGAGRVTFPPLRELQQYERLHGMGSDTPSKGATIPVHIFYRVQRAAPIERNTVRIDPPLTRGGGGFSHMSASAGFPFETLVSHVSLNVLRQGVQLKVLGDSELWTGKKHRVSLTLPIQREEKE